MLACAAEHRQPKRLHWLLVMVHNTSMIKWLSLSGLRTCLRHAGLTRQHLRSNELLFGKLVLMQHGARPCGMMQVGVLHG